MWLIFAGPVDLFRIEAGLWRILKIRDVLGRFYGLKIAYHHFWDGNYRLSPPENRSEEFLGHITLSYLCPPRLC